MTDTIRELIHRLIDCTTGEYTAQSIIFAAWDLYDSRSIWESLDCSDRVCLTMLGRGYDWRINNA